jgi:hypothetical protein
MTQQEALDVLVQSVRVANKRGAYELEESTIIAEAIKVFTSPQQEVTPPPQEEETENNS